MCCSLAILTVPAPAESMEDGASGISGPMAVNGSGDPGRGVMDSVRVSLDKMSMERNDLPYRRTTLMPPVKVTSLSEREVSFRP